MQTSDAAKILDLVEQNGFDAILVVLMTEATSRQKYYESQKPWYCQEWARRFQAKAQHLKAAIETQGE